MTARPYDPTAPTARRDLTGRARTTQAGPAVRSEKENDHVRPGSGGGRTLRAVGRGARRGGRARSAGTRPPHGLMARPHAGGHVPQVGAVVLQPVRPRGRPHPRGLLRCARGAHRARPAAADRHLHRLRAVVRPAGGPRSRGADGHRGRSAPGGLPAADRRGGGPHLTGRRAGRRRDAVRPHPRASAPAAARTPLAQQPERPEHPARAGRRGDRIRPGRAGDGGAAGRTRRPRPGGGPHRGPQVEHPAAAARPRPAALAAGPALRPGYRLAQLGVVGGPLGGASAARRRPAAHRDPRPRPGRRLVAA